MGAIFQVSCETKPEVLFLASLTYRISFDKSRALDTEGDVMRRICVSGIIVILLVALVVFIGN
jgi:hypothetical protein